MTDTPVGVIVGPTASGKTELAVAVAERVHGEVVNGDAYQIYRGLDIGTGKPSLAERRGIRHHLIDSVDPSRAVTVAEFQSWARDAIRDCHSRGVLPILTGGSSLYVRAVIDDFVFPGTDPRVRARWQHELDRLGPERLHDTLNQRDPRAAANILPSNGRRIVRALEVGELTGEPFQAELPAHVSVYDDVRLVGIHVDRELLDDRIAERVATMWDIGWPAEGAVLADQGLANWPTSSRALGYREVLKYISGELDRADAISSIIAGTRRFARRQQRLFDRDPRITWLGHDEHELLTRVTRILSP